MALPETHFPRAAAKVNDCLMSLCSSLSQTLYLARRCAEGFKSKHQQFLDLRCKIEDHFSFLQEILMFNDFNKYADCLSCSVELSEDLLLDSEIVQDLYTIFNEYLNYIVTIRKDLDDARSKSEVIVTLAKTELPELSQTIMLTQSKIGNIELFQIIPILKYMDILSTGKIGIFHQMLEHLNYLSYHWDIIEALNQLENHKEHAVGVDLHPETNIEDKDIMDKRVCYNDLLYNLSISSTAQAYINKILSFTKEEVEGKIEEICAKLIQIQRAMIYARQRIRMVTELLISET